MKTLFPFLIFCSFFVMKISAGNTKAEVFTVNNPDYQLSPITGMTRQHWVDAAEYILDGAFSYIHTVDDPMKFPKQIEKAYPNREAQLPTEKLEGLCRTLFVAAPLLKEKPDLVLNNIPVAEYYRHNLLNLINPEHPSYIIPRAANGGPSQILVEFGALAISLSVIPDLLWEPLTQTQKDSLAATMMSYGDGPTVPSNWRFFNIFVMSFLKNQGYEINEPLMKQYLQECIEAYRGCGWYNDSPAYDYYSMWAFQMYGPVWAQLYGKQYYPEYASQFMNNLADMVPNYPYMFNEKGEMNMWGRSIPYRFGAVIPLALTGYLENSAEVNYGWMRHISSSTMLQFLQNPVFMEERVPSLGFYGPFAPAVQGYSCRGSVYWMGKAFMALLLPKDNSFWTATENKGPWEGELTNGHVYSKFQPVSNLLITNYPNSGASEVRSWCHERVEDDWQEFRSSENYNKLAYNTEFPWMADGRNGEISMNYGVVNDKGEWEVLRLYTFKDFENGVYRRDAELETNADVKFCLADINLPDGILRVDKSILPSQTNIVLGHYALPDNHGRIEKKTMKVGDHEAYIISNGDYQLAMIPLYGWSRTAFCDAEGLHPVSNKCSLIQVKDKGKGEDVRITLQLWKKGNEPFTAEELMPVKQIHIADNKELVEVEFNDATTKTIHFNTNNYTVNP